MNKRLIYLKNRITFIVEQLAIPEMREDPKFVKNSTEYMKRLIKEYDKEKTNTSK